MRFLKGLLLPALLALTNIAAAKDKPDITATGFPHQLVNLFYFDDSNVALVVEFETGHIWRSEDAGKKWEKLNNDMQTLGIYKNPFDNQVAVAIGGRNQHWITYNQGKEWRSFETKYPGSFGPPVSFNARDNKKIIFNTIEDIMTGSPLGKSWYTEDGFKSEPTLLPVNRKNCVWARSSERFLLKSDKYDNRILCIAAGKYSDRVKDFRLLISDDYFKTEQEPVMSSGRTVQGMVNMASVKGYLVAAAKAEHSSELALYVTDDTETWHRAEFGEEKIEEDAYTILESTNYSIQVDVMTSKYAFIGSLYTSNSNGTYFTKNKEHTNRNMEGYVDFEKISNIQGIVMINVVQNWQDVKGPRDTKKLQSQISFDDGRTWDPLRIKGSKKELHLHSVTNLRNSGRVFSSPAPGIVMGVGNEGSFLGEYKDGDLYVSDDAGRTWELALNDAHKYEFGDQGSVLVAVKDEGDATKISYSLKHGRKDTWDEVDLGSKVRVGELTTVPDSTSLKFIIYGSRPKEEGGGREFVLMQIDFEGLHEAKCDRGKDFEKWYARVDDEGKGTCVMGHEQWYNRRKWDSECFIGTDFEDPIAKFDQCQCDHFRDYECDFNFRKEGTGKDATCVPTRALELPQGACKGDEKTYKGPSGWRKIPGNECKGNERDEEVERKCDEVSVPPSDGKVKATLTPFKGKIFREWYYLERDSKLDPPNAKPEDIDETIVMLTNELEAWITRDHGKKWAKAIEGDIVAIYPHQYNNDYVYFLTASKKVYYSQTRGKVIHDFEAPQMPNMEHLQIMQFHPGKPGWIIWIGGEHCEKLGPACHTIASVSQNSGAEWHALLPYVKKCAFVWREDGRNVNNQTVFCEQYTNEDMHAPVELVSSIDFFKNKEVKFKSVVEFATMSEFIIVATKGGEDGTSLKLDASLDANTFADAKFPPKFNVDHQTAYTVLDSSTHSVFLHVTVNPREDQEYGSIIKSNSNGTSYVLSINYVNRNTDGYVDFEKMQGIEGVALVNVVANPDKVDGGAKKLKRTLITHNDGADWDTLQVVGPDSDNKNYDCDVKQKDKCSLHLHGYTERKDPRETYSSPTAVGVMMGVGNVGETLGTLGDANTFITTDGGITWKMAKKGAYAWEFGDQGAIIVIVQRGQDTNHVYYSLDSGDNWSIYEFSDHKIRIDSITTVPSDTSLNFLLWGQDKNGLVTVNLDFSGLSEFEKDCKLDDNHPTDGDYDFWTPQHPFLDNSGAGCLFGHKAQYHRKKPTSKCKTGQKLDHLHNITENCACTRLDFECDYNFERQPGGECKQIAGLDIADAKAVCANKGVKEYWDVTGYRKIPLSTCEGGQEFDHTSGLHPCPGYEDEFERKHGMGFFGVLFAVIIPFVAAGGIGYWVWANWDGKFGRIRLGEGGGAFDSESRFVSWPVAAVSGLVAVVAAVPMVMGSVWNLAVSKFGGYGGRTYTSRSSFARGRGDYAVVDPDEGELLGEDSDEDV
ncbi:vacuolar protein sorting/targeting protein 10 [Pleomassaria siparia CBS 279.74]|uniref:Vacuolar protein sorting/targeting protein 10 n=1 Tax=Pleomassaria siparia CBS 279.74 TaxID=1314801 RepID=A0A6G1K4W5_9PLEO|nr:vacuolar protein sorting/targeting protein 10 [Pleomassaria siparia CBS 279.74]